MSRTNQFNLEPLEPRIMLSGSVGVLACKAIDLASNDSAPFIQEEVQQDLLNAVTIYVEPYRFTVFEDDTDRLRCGLRCDQPDGVSYEVSNVLLAQVQRIRVGVVAKGLEHTRNPGDFHAEDPKILANVGISFIREVLGEQLNV